MSGRPAPSRRQEVLRLMQAGDWRAALSRIDEASRTEPPDARWMLSRAQCLLALGRTREAAQAADAALQDAPRDPVVLDAIGSLFTQANDPHRALSAYARAVALAPDNPHFLFNRATVHRFLGMLAEAEEDYDRVVRLRPDDHEAYKNRSELRTQSPQANHVAQLEALVARGIADWRGYVQIRYALAKEHEDLGDHEKSFHHLELGARKRRKHLRYDVAADVETVDWIIEAYPGQPDTDSTHRTAADPDTDSTHRTAAEPARPCADAPIFIVGLPRSGTTLVDRILGSHPDIVCAGELNHFALAIVDAVRRASNGTTPPRRELVARSADLDFAALGCDYLERARHAVPAGTRFTDKMPLNYLYCGLIHRALPQARIVHVVRHPMAVCYAMYKTLFKDGYPFSYDLEDIGRYYLGYRRLMDHWHSLIPHLYTVSYEALVSEQEAETRKLLGFCGLDWQPACLDFHRNTAPTTTASAVQVRRRMYDSSIAQWRHYAQKLAPLRARLQAAGIDTR